MYSSSKSLISISSHLGQAYDKIGTFQIVDPCIPTHVDPSVVPLRSSHASGQSLAHPHSFACFIDAHCFSTFHSLSFDFLSPVGISKFLFTASHNSLRKGFPKLLRFIFVSSDGTVITHLYDVPPLPRGMWTYYQIDNIDVHGIESCTIECMEAVNSESKTAPVCRMDKIRFIKDSQSLQESLDRIQQLQSIRRPAILFDQSPPIESMILAKIDFDHASAEDSTGWSKSVLTQFLQGQFKFALFFTMHVPFSQAFHCVRRIWFHMPKTHRPKHLTLKLQVFPMFLCLKCKKKELCDINIDDFGIVSLPFEFPLSTVNQWFYIDFNAAIPLISCDIDIECSWSDFLWGGLLRVLWEVDPFREIKNKYEMARITQENEVLSRLDEQFNNIWQLK
ncbi:hypothetical protein ADUPG1_010374 [Aduncisulcus paluster]|uniref:Uncharacterized protein n=1 Tax=Aduncisulcus paluster TaxID=2918883 RepID=A0ABQ5JR42_9EUKA|nr:hypothetical protein ADUPG1_010374 [Aduncisulcus paluster]